MLEAIANDPEFYLEMDFQPGDIQFIANATILHAREAYDDHDDANERRHLLRLWLTAHDFASVDDVLRAGIPQQRR
jgi:alpha-ketoglutarate-dependent taurine dioxygenase